MELLLYGIGAIVLLFGGVVFFGAPYVPTLQPQVKVALDLLDLTPGQVLLELGSGDGKVLLAAAQRDIQVIGYELNPILVLIARWRTRAYRGKVQVIWGNAFTKPWPKTDGIYIFGVERIMPKLYKKITQSTSKPVKIVSFGFKIPGLKVHTQHKGLYLYTYAPHK